MKRFFNTLLFCLFALGSQLGAQTQSVAVNVGDEAFGLAEKDGLIYVAGIFTNTIYRFDPDAMTPTVEAVTTVPNSPRDMAFYGDVLYIGTDGDGIYRIDLGASMPMIEQVIPTPGSSLVGLAVAGDELFYCVRAQNRIEKLDLTAAMPSPVVVINSNLTGPRGLAFRGNTMYVAEANVDEISAFNYQEENPTLVKIADVPGGPVGLSINGSLLFTSVSGGLVQVNVNDATPAPSTVPGVSLSRPWASFVFDGVLFMTNFDDNRVFRVDGLAVTFSLPTLCADGSATAVLGGASPTGGVYSGPGVTDNGNGEDFTFDVAGQGTGSFNVTYTLGQNMVSTTLTVANPPTVTFSTGGLSVQVDAGLQTGLGGGMPTGGVYSGNGVTDDGNGMTYSFDPAAAGEGENVITYTFTDANGCGGEQGAIITVTPAVPPGDNCEIAIDINSLFGQTPGEPQVSEEYNTTEYNDDPSDPNSFSLCSFDWGTNNTVPSIWSTFTGDGSTYTINSTGAGDPFVLVFSGECGAFTEVACDDDTNGFNFSVEVETEVGVEYFVYTAPAVFSTPATFNIEVTRAILPGEQCDIAIDINNLFGQAEMVPQASDTYENFADYDTDNTDVVPSCLFQLLSGSGTIWFSFTGDGNRYTINSANNSNPANPLAGTVYTGTCGMLTEVTCAYTGGVANFTLDLQTEAGVEYSIMVTEDFVNQTESFNLEVTNMGTVSVQDIRNTKFNVYPNPTNGWVQLDGFTADRIEVLDQFGRTIRTQAQAGTGVDLTGLPAGVYVLRMQAGEEVISAKVVKE